MAQLRNLIKQGGVLGTTSTEEVSKLAAKQGRLAAPTTPLETGAIGGSPDQAKMAATPNQRINALRQQFNPTQDLATTQRRGPEQQPVVGADAKEQQLAAIQGLANLGERVRGIALRRFQQQEEAAEQLNFDTTDLELSEAQQAALNRIRGASDEKPTDEDYRIVADVLLGPDANARMSITDLVPAITSRLGFDSGAQAAGQAAGRIRLNELSPEDLTELGFTSFDQMAEQFNISSEQLQALTLSQMQDLIDSKQAAEFDRAAELRATLADPNVTQAERAAARAELQRLGISGEQDVERQYADLERQVREGRRVQFGGEEVDVERMLDDEYIKTKAKLILEDEEYRNKLYETDADFVDFIEKHDQAFKDLTRDVTTQAEQFVTLQEENLALAKPNEGMTTGFSDSVMSAWYEDWGDIKSSKYEENGIIQLMRTMDKKTAATMESVINSFADDPDILKDIGRLDLNQLKALGFTKPEAVDTWRNNKLVYDNIANTDANSTTFTAFLGADKDTLQELVSHAYALKQSGLGGPVRPEVLLLDANGDGKLDDMTSIKSKMLRGNLSLDELLARGKTVEVVSNPTINANNINEMQPNAKFTKMFDIMKPFLVGDGRIDAKEGAQLAAKLTGDEIVALSGKFPPGLTEAAKVEMKKKVDSDAKIRASEHYSYWIGEVRKTKTIPFGVDGRPMNISKPEDIFVEADKLKKEIDRLWAEYRSSKPGNSAFHLQEQQMRLTMLKEFAKEVAANTKGSSEDTVWEREAIKAVSNRLRKL